MEEIRDIGDLRYLYTAKRNDEGTLVYVVGGLPEDADDFRYPGDAIEPENTIGVGTCIKRGNGIAGEDSGYRLGKYFLLLIIRCIMNQEKSSVHLE